MMKKLIFFYSILVLSTTYHALNGFYPSLTSPSSSSACLKVILKNKTASPVTVSNRTIMPETSATIAEQCGTGNSANPISAIHVQLGNNFYFLPVPDPLDKNYTLSIQSGYEIIDESGDITYQPNTQPYENLQQNYTSPTQQVMKSTPTSVSSSTYAPPSSVPTTSGYRAGTPSRADEIVEATLQK